MMIRWCVLILLVALLSGCYWIAPPINDDNPNIDLLCRPVFHPVCKGDGHGGYL